jgi:RNA polymerase sigma factor (sigma-70 family)
LTVAAVSFEFSAVDRVFPRLPERYQTVLHLRFREEYSPQETARILGISTINVRVIQHRALKELRRLLDEA